MIKRTKHSSYINFSECLFCIIEKNTSKHENRVVAKVTDCRHSLLKFKS